MANNWTTEELTGAVKVYIEMVKKTNEGEKVVKSHYYKKLASEFDRSAKSFEFRMQNISYVYTLLGLEYLKGLKPAKNVGKNVIIEIKSIIKKVS